jgi:NAD(P)-dependent dehydrogenase (short-subunit alcohol dehydrogenase family)
MFQSDLLRGKRILVTGGGTGLGAAMAKRFGELGASLVLCGRRTEVLEDTAARLRGIGIGVAIAPCDLRDSNAVEEMVAAIWNEGPVDVLINNAAASFIAQTETLSHRAADAVLNISLHGALYCTLSIGKRWIESSSKGIVLSILSTSTITGRAFTVPSAMAKSGLLAMTRSLAVEWGPKGIRLVAIAPGPFPTPATKRQLTPDERTCDPSQVPFNPMGRVGEHIELANLASYLVSDQASYINGEMVAIDGGMHLRSSGAEDLLGWTQDQWNALRTARNSQVG